MTSGYINIPEDRDRPVYRIASLGRLYELFAEKKNVLVKPEAWDDPYENLRSRLKQSTGTSTCYGQCWTLHTASDAMWRIYSPITNKDPRQHAVRIRSTIRCLFESLRESCGPTQSAFVGKVRYLRTPALMEHVKRRANSSKPSTVADSLLVKRPAFRHEREVRLLLVSPRPGKPLFSYSLDPHTFVSQIMLDPRLDRSQADQLKEEIRSRTRFAGLVKRSLLYAPPEL